MAGATMSIKGVLTVLPKSILPKIEGGPTREGLIKLHQLISKNVASVASNLGGGHHRHLALIMTREDYTSQMVFPFVLPHNPGNYPPTAGNSQDQALGTEKFRQNQAMFCKYTAVDGDLKIKLSRRWNQFPCPHWWTI